uniref:Uncharacterized protein n=1 Tax=Pararge aegeria TaxID=116150 RepID=S4NTN6_9NEOP
MIMLRMRLMKSTSRKVRNLIKVDMEKKAGKNERGTNVANIPKITGRNLITNQRDVAKNMGRIKIRKARNQNRRRRKASIMM